MKQIIQNFGSGLTSIESISEPHLEDGSIKIRTTKSLLSLGTEKMLVKFGKSNLLSKALSQPERVKQVFAKLKTDGLKPTLETVFTKLDAPIPLGYCNVGQVIEVSESASMQFKVGDRVISNGPHAEIVVVNKNLCCKIPNEIPDESAVFTQLGAISMQGIRLANPTIGETFVVIGLGLVGLLTVQILLANGCKVLAVDYDVHKCDLAKSFGADALALDRDADSINLSNHIRTPHGADGVLITAATESNAPIKQAAQCLRKRGRVILVGVVGLDIDRSDFYEKEISFQVSCSFGPGRYEREYEEKGLDYPIGFVRWTEQRNFEAVLTLIADKKIKLNHLISEQYPFSEAEEVYKKILLNNEQLGIIFNFEKSNTLSRLAIEDSDLQEDKAFKANKTLENNYSFIGSGSYAAKVLIPLFYKNNVLLDSIVSKNGISGQHLLKKFKFKNSLTDALAPIKGNSKNIIIVSRHDSHFNLVHESLKNGKNIFCEKPLCLDNSQLEVLKNSYDIAKKYNPHLNLTVGFNRRFSKLTKKARSKLLHTSTPVSYQYNINAGFIPSDHWTQDSEVGGGRVKGELCHFLDLIYYLDGSKISHFSAFSCNDPFKDSITVNLKFESGSIASINYFTNGSNRMVKENLKIFFDNKIMEINNFSYLKFYGFRKSKNIYLRNQDKGQAECVKNFIVESDSNLASSIKFEEIYHITRLANQISASIL